MKKKLVPICAMALLTVGYSSTASANAGSMPKEEVTQVQQDQMKKEAAMQQQNQDKMKKEAAMQQQNQDKMKKDQMKQEAAKKVTKGEKLPNTASNNILMMALSAGLLAIGSVFGFTRRKNKA
ncbi:LPXTG-motif cell wall anchor domain-containing protein [Bacillus toyonensis]|uniref:LPXTG cell wall anchor domain-containing protein n=1 Tax=Bacillus toyonensis TaxID=155322 RepID=UPI0008908D34|nr:LPXTG cell wall anchor domain-containing protein [Bacillus toyonensis]PEP88480.1 cell surface protein [Bacillus toyonensis]PHC73478.1 cell surface protein [Bacillus toyonensis]SDL51909.1 LPXTG-motif cell wall anchor domain-containing protein [Bacillus toyonensis]